MKSVLLYRLDEISRGPGCCLMTECGRALDRHPFLGKSDAVDDELLRGSRSIQGQGYINGHTQSG